MKAPGFWRRGGAALPRLLLTPFSLPWRVVAPLRRAMTRPVRAQAPVICVGNLTVGGAGKTPTVMLLAAWFRTRGAVPGILARGYRGSLSSSKPVIVDPSIHTAQDVGDEALLHAGTGPVVICADRGAGARLLAPLCDVILMDDGFQNPTLTKDMSVLVVDAAEGLGNGAVVPAGPLRESVGAGLLRANAIIAIGPGILDSRLGRSGLPVLRGHLKPVAGSDVRDQRIIGFSGIGRPEKFRQTLEEMGGDIIAFHPFPDHHAFTSSEFDRLAEEAAQLQAMLVTTSKDAVRLTPEQRSQVKIVEVALELAQPDMLDALLTQIRIPASDAARPSSSE